MFITEDCDAEKSDLKNIWPGTDPAPVHFPPPAVLVAVVMGFQAWH